MTKKSDIIAKIKNHFLLSDEIKEFLLKYARLANEKQLAEIEVLLNKDQELINDLFNDIWQTKQANGRGEEFNQETEKLIAKSISQAGREIEKNEHLSELETADDLLNDM